MVWTWRGSGPDVPGGSCPRSLPCCSPSRCTQRCGPSRASSVGSAATASRACCTSRTGGSCSTARRTSRCSGRRPRSRTPGRSQSRSSGTCSGRSRFSPCSGSSGPGCTWSRRRAAGSRSDPRCSWRCCSARAPIRRASTTAPTLARKRSCSAPRWRRSPPAPARACGSSGSEPARSRSSAPPVRASSRSWSCGSTRRARGSTEAASSSRRSLPRPSSPQPRRKVSSPRLLGTRPLVAIGAISYGLYLWHWPVDVVLDASRTGLDGVALLLLRVGVTLGIAVLSYRLVEAPIRSGGLSVLTRRTRAGLRRAAGPALAGSVAAVLMISTLGAVSEPSLAQLAEAQARPRAAADPAKARVLMLGDSQMLTLWFYGSAAFTASGPQYEAAAVVGCGLLFPGMQPGAPCQNRAQTWQAAIRSFDPDLSVVLVGAFETLDFTVGGHRYRHATPEHERELARVVARALRPLTARGGRVALLEVPPFGNPLDDADGGQRSDPASVANVNGALRAGRGDEPARDVRSLGGRHCSRRSVPGTGRRRERAPGRRALRGRGRRAPRHRPAGAAGPADRGPRAPGARRSGGPLSSPSRRCTGVGAREQTSDSMRLRYQPALDGLRAVAVLAVIGYHAGVGSARRRLPRGRRVLRARGSCWG